MFRHWHFILLVLASLALLTKQSGPSPILLNTSSQHYGPDGPWQAITVWLGSQPTPIDLYPGGIYGSVILSLQACEASSSPCGLGGVFDPSGSTTFDDHSIRFEAFEANHDISWDSGTLKYRGDAKYVMDQLADARDPEWIVQNFSTILATKISMIYPDGSKYPLQVGQLALGAPSINQTFPRENVRTVNASLLTGSLKEQNKISRSSYGLHVGSASLGPRLSLWIGGYDASRIVGPVSTQPVYQNVLPVIDLLDIGIGVDHGQSPFSFPSRDHILTDESSSVPSWISVVLNPSAPYLALPNSTCAAIANSLPVTYQTKYGLYFWNVDDVQYQRIVTSPSYLSFTFRASGPITRLVIKVPFKLLNLTLEAPLIDKPTFYFPCQPPQASSTYSLGRAFLQAAFLGVDWDGEPPRWHLAQAPGPNTASSPYQMEFGDNNNVTASSIVSWNVTWEGYWVPLADENSTSSTTPSADAPSPSGHSSSKPAKGGLSTGAKVAIGITCLAIVVLVLLGRGFYRRRFPESLESQISPSYLTSAQFQHPGFEAPSIAGRAELADRQDRRSGFNNPPVRELDGVVH